MKDKPWQPDSWLPRHSLVCQMHAAGLKNNEIAAATGYTESKVSTILNDPRAQEVIQAALQTMSKNIMDLHTRLKVHAVEALDEIVDELRSSENEKVRQKAAFGLLDRAGYTPVKKQIVMGGQIPKDLAERVERNLDKQDSIDAEYSMLETEVEEEEPDDDGR